MRISNRDGMSSYELPPTLQGLAQRQHQLVTRIQLAESGFSPDAVRRRVATSWRMVLPGVVLLGRVALDPTQKLIAAQLHAGADAVVTGAAAARWHGLRYAEADEYVDVLVSPTRRQRSAGFVRTRRTRRPVRPTRGGGILQIAPVARAVADACRVRADERYATALVLESIQRGKTDLPSIVDELHAGPTRGSASLRRAVTAAAGGAWSAPESDLILLVASSMTLPRPWANPELSTLSGLRLPTPDLWLDDVGMAIQVHSYAHHAAGPDWERTIRADSALAEAGILRISLTPSEIAHRPRATLRRIEAMHASRSPTDRPPIRMTPRVAPLR
ncbi:type IV toxin-antitoxin system AbiEi family antitoxin [Cellulomonas rhizosphaerae]|uniref:Transcriptional regulator, AbiEi antitoxin, Type IV TA system n=1 Tax=Cellulomonas rhizosphaerae TaxID=2293719 RepID=A0A413RHA5_9CELL|nr:hypothetical protein [Cellulomonas rhizosphaerae]RHA37523.1 hypothetical protein D1825_16770 [Cellulomonas rhizosphaerae]